MNCFRWGLVIDLLLVDEKNWRKRVQEAAIRASKNPVINTTALGKEAGWTSPAFAAFRKKGVGKIEKLKKLEGLLRELNIIADKVPDDHDVEAEPRIQSRPCPACGECSPSFFGGRILLFCGHCGADMGVECQKCGHLNADTVKNFCSACGAPLSDEGEGIRESIDSITEPERSRRVKDAHRRHLDRRKKIDRGEEIDF